MASSPVRLWEGILDLPTYPIGPEDPYPPFQRTGNWWIYPYPMQDDLMDVRRDQGYAAIFMENEYLRLTILPTLGGRLYSVFDKTTGQEVFYRNRVFKPGLIALRGAWISGGIEFNFPHGHTVSTVSPVKCVMRQNEDGSATVTVGDIDRVSRMIWSVSLTLSPGRAAVQVDIRLENRTPFPHRYYFWSNAAVPATPRMQFIYPMVQATTGRGIVRFPIHEGRDLSWYVNHPHAVDLFAKDPYDDFFGCYDHDADRGVVNVTDTRRACGKKFFTWGTAGSGRLWETLLTDEDGPYCEIQSGRFATQGIHRMMPPYAVERWQEVWWPLKGMGGFCYANERMALQLERREDGLRVALNATEPVPRARLIIRPTEGQAPSVEFPVSVSPEVPFNQVFPVPPEVQRGLLHVQVVTMEGNVLLDYREQEHHPAPASGEQAEGPPVASVETLCLEARRHEEENRPREAKRCYERALEQDPGSIRAHTGLAILACKRALWEEAERHLERALQRDPEDPEANWTMGIVQRERGNLDAAARHFARLERFPGYAYRGLHALGELALLREDWDQATQYFGEALQHHVQASRTYAWLALVFRRQGNGEAARELVQMALRDAPLDPLLHAEQSFAVEGTEDEEETRYHQLCLMRADVQAYLEVAMDYMSIGAWQEASEILRMAVGESVEEQAIHPIVCYALGYCHAQVGDQEKMQAYYRLGGLMSHRTVFPHRHETIRILQHALQVQPEDARAHYYLGNLFMARDRVDEALAAWRRAVELDPSLTEAHRNLGLCLAREKRALPEALQAYQRAIETDPASYRLYLEWEDTAREAKLPPAERLAFLDAAPPEVTRRGEIAARQVALLLELGQFQRAVDLLNAHTFRPWEGAWEMRQRYVQAHLGMGQEKFASGDFAGALESFEAALEYPVHIGVGQPPQPAHAEILFWAGLAAEMGGEPEKARAHWQAATEETHEAWGMLRAAQAAAWLNLGERERGETMARQLIAEAPETLTPEHHLALGLLYLALGQGEQGHAHLEPCSQATPRERAAAEALKTWSEKRRMLEKGSDS